MTTATTKTALRRSAAVTALIVHYDHHHYYYDEYGNRDVVHHDHHYVVPNDDYGYGYRRQYYNTGYGDGYYLQNASPASFDFPDLFWRITRMLSVESVSGYVRYQLRDVAKIRAAILGRD